MTTCGECEFYEAANGSGKCKCKHAERHVIPKEAHSGAKEIINGWPEVNASDGSCGDFAAA